MIKAGVISFVPSHAKPPHGLLKVDELIAAWYVPGFTSLNSKPPSAPVEVDCTVLPPLRNCTDTPGRLSSPCSTLPATPPPGLKSRHTAPVISPGFAAGCAACFAPFGTASG